ncbi:hypothetical protein B0H14DRAFT_2392133 [Mycena olivaceomarginata]|nr:hypothetical protein B0H14DRAFT_2392133 [Mycena olivaceomarginata]
MSNETLLPDGSEWLLRMDYTSREVHGVTVLVVFSCFSLTAVVGLLLAISLSAFNTRSWTTDKHPHLFVRTHVAAYFISLLLSDLIQAIGSILNARWIRDMAVVVGDVCTLQGVLKQTADVATAFWTLVIAIHTFCLICLGLKSSRFTLWMTLIAGWSGIGAIVMAGPAAQNTPRHQPFYGISGFWCWISPEYATSRITYMFMAAAFSFVLYTLVFLRMRGNIIIERRRISFRRRAGSALRGNHESRTLTIAKQMLLYPVAYTIIVLPIAASRFSSFAGQDVPFELWLISAAVFLLSGVVKVTVFTMTRRILPSDSFKIPKWTISHPQPIPEYTIEAGADSYYKTSGTYMGQRGKKYSSDIDSARTTISDVPTMLAPPPRSHLGNGKSVYNLYEANSPIHLAAPADVEYYEGNGR